MATTYRQNQDVAWRRIRGKQNALLVLPRTCNVVGLSPVATVIWEQMEEWKSLDELVTLLGETFDAPGEVIARDASEFVASMVERDLVEEKAEGAREG